jgi:hypothetical protein
MEDAARGSAGSAGASGDTAKPAVARAAGRALLAVCGRMVRSDAAGMSRQSCRATGSAPISDQVREGPYLEEEQMAGPSDSTGLGDARDPATSVVLQSVAKSDRVRMPQDPMRQAAGSMQRHLNLLGGSAIGARPSVMHFRCPLIGFRTWNSSPPEKLRGPAPQVPDR